MAGGTPALPWVVSSAISLFTVSMTGLGLWFSHRASNKTMSLQDTAERVKAEQHLVELLQEENDRIRTAWAQEVQKAKADCAEELGKIEKNIATQVEAVKEELRRERESHDLTRHRYISDVAALRAIVRDEIARSAGEDVRDIMAEAQPPPIDPKRPIKELWPEEGDFE